MKRGCNSHKKKNWPKSSGGPWPEIRLQTWQSIVLHASCRGEMDPPPLKAEYPIQACDAPLTCAGGRDLKARLELQSCQIQNLEDWVKQPPPPPSPGAPHLRQTRARWNWLATILNNTDAA